MTRTSYPSIMVRMMQIAITRIWNSRIGCVRIASRMSISFLPRWFVRLCLRVFRKTRSVGRAPAREVEHGSGREGALLGAQPRDQGRDLLDRAEAPHRDLREHELHV